MNLDLALLAAITGKKPNDNMRSYMVGIETRGAQLQLDRPEVFAQYNAQWAHESGLFQYDRELWNGKGAQARYDTRTDLGNTPEQDGDGYKYRGHTMAQITGAANTKAFYVWCSAFAPDCPNFLINPEAMLADPWEGLGPIWYWESRKLTAYALVGDIENITKKINGGLNGYQDRCDKYAQTALVLLGYGRSDLTKFQAHRGLKMDNDPGPNTRAALHGELKSLPALVIGGASAPVGPVEDFLSASEALTQIAAIMARVK